MEFITAYLAGVVALTALWALRVPHENVRTVFALAMMWPLSIVAVLFMVVLSATGWDLDVARGSKMFGFRKPTNKEVQGFAISLFYGEVQFWKARKV